ncbi:hypothetical protein CC80DRAFT_193370 [Byssothecium circinans]|uniref:Zn(2)-C6 fungal-type domain-containing protein n=1 Tax=Byssothecium circinans TaxID=147558 RepID=A0A6A5TLQ2_9PLEO|nr:hypothetical protein CC80DRAFT_193370 [Byssothecium circinans]
MSILDALQPTSDPKERMRKQRAIAKCCVDSIQKIDGYRYSFHNCWNSREDNAFRFSYYCNDSLLNKDRAANGKGTKLGKRATKPVFDCKGVLSVKFSASKQTLDVFYKHVPMHATYEARAPAPRKDSKRRKFLQETDPEALERIQTRPRAPRVGTDSNAELEWKRKRSSQAFKSQTSLESDLRAESLVNLLDLIRRDIPSEPVYPEPPEAPRPPPPPPRRAPAPIIATVNRPVQQQPSQAPQQPPRKRPRNSCDVCKAKKTKCDGTRPVCQTCIDKKRQCVYSDMNEDRRPSAVEPVETIRQAQAANSELSELERMKKELEEAKARIHELEEERRRTSITPSQTPQMNRQPAIQPPPPPQSQPQPQSDPKPPPVAHPSQRQQKQKQQNHGTQQQQQQKQKPQMQIRNTQSPQAIQQLQNAAQQLQDPQQMSNSQQLQSPQFNHFGNQAPNPYGLSRPMSTQTMPQNMSSNTGHASQSQTNQMSTGLAPTAETSNAYGREFVWPAHQYYGFQAAQQHQPDQWNASRNSGVYR